MRNQLRILFLTLSLSCLSQNHSQKMIKQIAQNIGIQNTDIYSRLTTSQKFDIGTLFVIPEIAEKGNGYVIFNSNIILIDDKTGEIKARFTGQKDWYIDAVSIDKIKIEPKIHQLNKKTMAIGLKLYYSNRSQPNPYSSIQLSLYAFDGKNLKRVLKDFSIKITNGKTDSTCKGKFEKHSKDMQVLNTYSNKFADLKFIDKIEISERDEDCEKVSKETSKKFEILKYENGEYKIIL